MKHLAALYAQSDATDRSEGRVAYERYHRMMRRIALRYDFPVGQTTAAFVALSPNSDYKGNLRSLVSVLDGLSKGVDPDRITVSTYKHCRDRAVSYLTGRETFLQHAKGSKTRAFYRNILTPGDPAYVTVDGHMFYAWSGKVGTMHEARVTPKLYVEIEDDIKLFARCLGIVPNQLQATLWFARKRIMKVLYDPQLDMFSDATRTEIPIDEIEPYPIVEIAA